MVPDSGPEPLSDLEFYRMIRSRLEHEDSLVVNRLSWLVASQAFLFSAYAIAQNTPTVGGHPAALLRIVPIIGIASVGLIYAGLLAAASAMRWLKRELQARVPDTARLGLPPIQAPGPTRAAGLAAPLVLPVVFALAWLYLLLA